MKMVNLSFTDKELETLKEYFQSELFKAEEKIDNIRGILGKIGKRYGTGSIEIKKSPKKAGRPKTIKAVAGKKKPGPKPKKALAELVQMLAKKEPTGKKRGRPAKVKAVVKDAEASVINEKPVAKAKTGPKKAEKAKDVKKATSAIKKVKKAAVAKKAAPKIVKAKKVKGVVKVKAMPKAKAPKKVKTALKAKADEKVKAITKLKEIIKAKSPKIKVASKPKSTPKPKTTENKKTVINASKWSEWVTEVVKENPQLIATQIADAVIVNNNLKGDNLTNAANMVKKHLNNLEKAGKIMSYGEEGAEPMYGLKPTE